MNIESIRDYCLSLEAVSESFPFDDVTLVFKVGSKMFGLLSLEKPFSMNLKCDPEMAVELRERHPFIVPGFHMNKKHWNTINDIEQVASEFMKQMIHESYRLAKKSLTKKERKELSIKSDE